MQELLYLLRVPQDEILQEVLQDLLACAVPPAYVRLSTMAPLSNWGYTPDSVGAILAVSDSGVVVGVEGNNSVPRTFVPWQNISYLAESGGLETANVEKYEESPEGL